MRLEPKRWRRPLLWALLGLALLALLLTPLARRQRAESASTPALAWVLQWPSRASAAVREGWQALWVLRQAEAEARRLRQENTLLKLEMAQLRGRLQSLAPKAGQGGLGHQAIPAGLLARDPSTWFNYVVLDKGLAVGVRPGSGVVDEGGVLGKVVSCTEATSRMVFVVDPACKLAVRLARSGVKATLAGSGRRSCVLLYLAGTDDVRVGDLVETAAEGSIFPPGIPVGLVSRVEKRDAGLALWAEVKPFARPSQVNTVFVLGGRP